MSEEKNKGGRPPHSPTLAQREICRELYACGISKARIAERFGIDQDTLAKHYVEELDNNKEHMVGALAKNLYQDALNGDEKAREFWLKCQGRWSYAKPPEDTERDKQQTTLMERLIDKL
jgi:SOS response regulatory protein OraA/RecX